MCHDNLNWLDAYGHAGKAVAFARVRSAQKSESDLSSLSLDVAVTA